MSTEEKYRCLNKDAIKYIAMFTMLLNHIATVFMDPSLQQELFLFTQDILQLLL